VLTYDTINVALGNACVVRDLNVRIDNVTHTFDSDLRFYLRKGSTAMRIINRAGGSGDNFIGTVLNDSAATNINSGFAPFTGQYSPSTPASLAAFNNQATDGGWILTITDTVSGGTGLLSAWCLVISYQCPVGGIQTVEIPNYYALTQNYPNPFNPATVISFALPKTEDVRLVVYDISGREVATLVNELKQAGIYDVHFDASNLASGVYLYRIETTAFTQTKKMLFIK
jgi:subtilisin-like proprotein convertase family protein